MKFFLIWSRGLRLCRGASQNTPNQSNHLPNIFQHLPKCATTQCDTHIDTLSNNLTPCRIYADRLRTVKRPVHLLIETHHNNMSTENIDLSDMREALEEEQDTPRSLDEPDTPSTVNEPDTLEAESSQKPDDTKAEAYDTKVQEALKARLEELRDVIITEPIIATCCGVRWVPGKNGYYILCGRPTTAEGNFAFCSKAHRQQLEKAENLGGGVGLFQDLVHLVNTDRRDLQERFYNDVVPFYFCAIAIPKATENNTERRIQFPPSLEVRLGLTNLFEQRQRVKVNLTDLLFNFYTEVITDLAKIYSRLYFLDCERPQDRLLRDIHFFAHHGLTLNKAD